MNLIQVQDRLKMLPDQQLQQELRSGDPSVQALVMSEVQRRQKMRQGGMQKGPQKSIYEQMLGQSSMLPNTPVPGAPPVPPPQTGKQPGLAGVLPQSQGMMMPPGMMPQQGAGLGQAVQPMASGGEVRHLDTGGTAGNWYDPLVNAGRTVGQGLIGLADFGNDPLSWMYPKEYKEALDQWPMFPNFSTPPAPTLPNQVARSPYDNSGISRVPAVPSTYDVPGATTQVPLPGTAGIPLTPATTSIPSLATKDTVPANYPVSLGASLGENQYGDMFDRAAKEFNVDPLWLRSMGWTESKFDPTRIGTSKERGMLQVKPDTWGDLGFTDPNDIEQEVRAGAKYFRQKLDQNHGDYRLATIAYNAGQRNVNNPPQSTLEYLKSVTGQYGQRMTPGVQLPNGVQLPSAATVASNGVPLPGTATAASAPGGASKPSTTDSLMDLFHRLNLDQKPPDLTQFKLERAQLPGVEGELDKAREIANKWMPPDESYDRLQAQIENLRQYAQERPMSQGEKLVRVAAGMRNPWDFAGGFGAEIAAEDRERDLAFARQQQVLTADEANAARRQAQQNATVEVARSLAGLYGGRDVAQFNSDEATNRYNQFLAMQNAQQGYEAPYKNVQGLAATAQLMEMMRQLHTPNLMELFTDPANADILKKYQEFEASSKSPQMLEALINMLRLKFESGRFDTEQKDKAKAEASAHYMTWLQEQVKNWQATHYDQPFDYAKAHDDWVAAFPDEAALAGFTARRLVTPGLATGAKQ